MLLPRRASKGQGIHISSRPALSPDRDPTLHAAQQSRLTMCFRLLGHAHSTTELLQRASGVPLSVRDAMRLTPPSFLPHSESSGAIRPCPGPSPMALRHRVGGPGLRVRYSFEPRPGTEVPNRHAHMRRHRKRSWRPPRTRVPRWTPRAGCSPRPSGRGPWVRAEIRAVLNFLNAGARGISSRSIVVRDPRTAASLREEGEGTGL